MNKPRARLVAYHRQGFCHVSQLLELLFVRYGIDSNELRESAGTQAIANGGAPAPAVQALAGLPANVSSAASPGSREQTTFSWFQPAELTV